MKKQNIFKTFNEGFFKSVKGIKWYDTEGFMELNGDRLVRISITDRGHSDKFSGYDIEILSKVGGTICKKFFKFDNFIEFTGNRNDTSSHVWYDKNIHIPKFDWYINRPIDVKPMVDVMMEFINTFKIPTEKGTGGCK